MIEANQMQHNLGTCAPTAPGHIKEASFGAIIKTCHESHEAYLFAAWLGSSSSALSEASSVYMLGSRAPQWTTRSVTKSLRNSAQLEVAVAWRAFFSADAPLAALGVASTRH